MKLQFVRLKGIVAVIAALGASSTFALEINLPQDTVSYRASDQPGYPLVLQNCLTCHSAHYPQMQPGTSPRGYWEATVKKMKKPFGAQFPDADMPAMIDYLVKNYGAERGTIAATAK